jgi:hypothetical protein
VGAGPVVDVDDGVMHCTEEASVGDDNR